jgi:dCTP deaminase
MIDPFVQFQISKSTRLTGPNKLISFGLSSAGYDMRCTDRFKLFKANSGLVDPKNFDPDLLEDFEGSEFIIPPNSYALTSSYEYFQIPENILGIAVGKSTYARSGIHINTTPLEPGWRGHLTIEISNSCPSPVKIYSYEGIAQVLFFMIDAPTVSYSSRSGKYQNQPDRVVLPIA